MVTGTTEFAAKLLSLKDQTFCKVVEAVEKTAVRIANDARAGHEHGSDPHARGRYENQTSNLSNSVGPGGPLDLPMQWSEVTEDRIVGLCGIMSTAPATVLEYAPKIEELYPFIWPAAVANIERFQEEVKRAMNPDSK